ncbi:MAG: 23S rRNA (uracil(1939)-C(5))-methyltransferase RlmD [Candidatus Gastranaerophilales bacterium]|nr:23S rRNA (uracil(1939)-C(5))-methyltransferase RlmD [Candidatus Gastranaerophilales bacterium]
MEEIIVKIEKLSSDGSGIARDNGIVIFIDKTCPDDICRIKIVKKTKSYYIGELIEIIEPSPHRIKPFCPMHNVCGACRLQFIDYDYQLKIKKQITEDCLKGIETVISDTIPSPKTREFRRKIQYPIRQTQVSKRILAGYFKQKSHDIVNIKYCPIQPKICDEIIEYIRENAPKYNIDGYDEKKHKGLLRHVVIRVSKDRKEVLAGFVINASETPERLKDFAINLYDKFDDISGVSVNYNEKKTNLILSDRTELITGRDYIEETLCNVKFKIGTNTFFQVNPKSAENIFRFVKEYIAGNYDKPVLLDAYAGISAFGLVLADICSSVVSVEECAASVELAKDAAKMNGTNNIEFYSQDCTKYLRTKSVNGGKLFDVSVLDPPRKGCSEESLDYTLKLTKSEIIYVSCNPATLARDLKYLIQKGAIVKSVQPFDMFCHTNHIENVAIIDLSNCS